MRTMLTLAAAILSASAALAGPTIWLEYEDYPEALMVGNDSGEALDACQAVWTITYGKGEHYTEMALVNLPADGKAEVTKCERWWDTRWHNKMDVFVCLFSPDGKLLCDEAYDGVFNLVPVGGYPTEGWSAKASRGADTANAFDGDAATRWATGAPMEAGDWFTLDMGEAKPVAKVILDGRGSPEDYPGALEVAVSTDGEKFTTVAKVDDVQAISRGGLVKISFDPTDARYIKVTCTKARGSGWFWSIHELAVVGPEA
jgi:hypothetical protein